ncbi:hypothetical protein [Azotobacter chroococcum]|uniref:hypothetical protein n=1 Tax=Azotobacter chroococcum TaxID=353 RepID=UPI00058A0619|nr:hypothetical protein [Azotobacter chroococcum]
MPISIVRAAALHSSAFSFAKACSIGLWGGSYETVRRWSVTFGLGIARRYFRSTALARGDQWYLDEVAVAMQTAKPCSRASDRAQSMTCCTTSSTMGKLPKAMKESPMIPLEQQIRKVSLADPALRE